MSKKKSIMMKRPEAKTYQELHEEYIRFCKIQKLAEETIRTYHYHHNYFMNHIGSDALCSEINQQTIDNYKLTLIEKGLNGVSVNSYIQNITPVIKYGMKLGYIDASLTFARVKEEQKIKDIYTQGELQALLKKPNIKKCSFAEYRNYAIINVLIGTGIRSKELRNIRVGDLDMENDLLRLQTTKNGKARFIPLSTTLISVMTEYLSFRQAKSEDDYLFSNVYGDQMYRTTLQMGITKYCLARGVNKYSLHLFRHTFATNYLRRGGSPFTLQRILGHSSLKMVNHHLAFTTKDLQNEFDAYSPLEEVVRTRITVKR